MTIETKPAAPPRSALPARGSLPQAPPKNAPTSGAKVFSIGRVSAPRGRRVGLYGNGGVGKTSLVDLAPKPVCIDLDDSLPAMEPPLEHIAPVNGVETWDDLRAVLRDHALLAPFDTVAIDSMTRAQELCEAHVLRTVKTEKGDLVRRLEDYGYGKGLTHVYDTFLPILADLDALIRAGKNVVLVMHSCTADVPNPSGENYIRWEPRMQDPKSGKSSIRLRIREWLDELSFIGHDVAAKNGKATASGARTIYPVETAFCMAKSRSISEPLCYVCGDNHYWREIGVIKETE